MLDNETTAQTAAEAFARYRDAFDHDLLIQAGWHSTDDDGRQLACALGVLGSKIDGAEKCPAAIMPRWLAQMVPWFFDNQGFADAKAWGLRFYAELDRLKGVVPFSVVHDWQANVVGPLAIEVATKRKRDVAAHEALAAMQREALAGKKFTADEWRPVLKAAFRDANAYANAYAYAYANANAYAGAGADAAKRAAIKRLADGMVECLSRVSAEAAHG